MGEIETGVGGSSSLPSLLLFVVKGGKDVEEAQTPLVLYHRLCTTTISIRAVGLVNCHYTVQILFYVV